MRRILIASSKGGCGKTTLATNLAVALAHAGKRVWMIDADPQASSAEWCRARAGAEPQVGCLHSAEPGSAGSSGWTLRIPPDTEFLLVDTPAGLRPFQLAEFLRRVDSVLVPVVPSAIDTRASKAFLADLAAAPAVRGGQLAVGLVANRVKARTVAARQLPEFIDGVAFSQVASLRDSQAYVLAGALDRGLFDYSGAAIAACREDWNPLLEWLLALRATRP